MNRITWRLFNMVALVWALVAASAIIGNARTTAAQRSAAARRAFMVASGYPQGRPGYVVDHIRPLCYGGDDKPANMQWQTIAAAKTKDADERALCAAWRHFQLKGPECIARTDTLESQRLCVAWRAYQVRWGAGQ